MSQQTTLHATEEGTALHVVGSVSVVAERGQASGESCHREPWQERKLKYPGSGTHADPYVVDWDLGDPENPYNWSNTRKWAITGQVSHPFEFRLR